MAFDILRPMAKTSVEIDRDLISEAAEILGTGTLRDTIDAALREVVNVRRRLGVLALLADNDRFDLASMANAWRGGEP